METEVEIEEDKSLDDELSGASLARQKIVDRINSLDIENFDITPWEDPYKIVPLPKQSEFFKSEAQITFYGGAAGAGKTEAIIMDQLRHVHDPKFESITFRKNSSSLIGAGGIFNKAGNIYLKLGATQTRSHQNLKYIFPSGATARYSHLDGGKTTAESNHSGLEYSAIYFDELHTFGREEFFFMLTRLRSNADMQSYVKACMNPCTEESQGGWAHEFLKDFFIDSFGYPLQENSGKIRWFVADEDGNLSWGDTKEELYVRHGLDCDPMSFTFISALITDNPVLCKKQPAYLRALRNSGRVERERLLFGCWNVAPKGGGYFQREWVDYIDRKDLPKMTKLVRCWDLAGSVKSEVNNDPDATASVLMGVDSGGTIYIIDASELYGRPAQVSEALAWKSTSDGKNTTVGIPQDPSAAGKLAFSHYANPLIHKGFKVKKLKTRKGKLERFQPFSNAAENNMVIIVRGAWNKKYIQQLEDFDPERKRGHDDFVDATSDSYNQLIGDKSFSEGFSLNLSKKLTPNVFEMK